MIRRKSSLLPLLVLGGPLLVLSACDSRYESDESARYETGEDVSRDGAAEEPDYETATTVSDDVDRYDWGTWDTWDTDADTWISEAEWKAGYERVGYADDWFEGDDNLTEDDWQVGIFEDWDLDGDDYWDADEWDRYTTAWYIEPAATEFVDWDGDQDERLSRDEVERRIRQDLWRRTDANDDGQVSRGELQASLWDVFDRDDDGRIGRQEFDAGTERLANQTGEGTPGG